MNFQRVKNQNGATFWGLIWGVALFLSACYLFIITIPPYLDNQKLRNALVSLTEEPTVMNMSRMEMIRLLNRKLNIDYGDDIVDLKRAFKVVSVGAKRDLSIDYELVVPLVYNVSLLFDFKNHVTAPNL